MAAEQFECPLWVRSGHWQAIVEMSALGQKWTYGALPEPRRRTFAAWNRTASHDDLDESQLRWHSGRRTFLLPQPKSSRLD